jgi:DNA-binding MarR family transcriptional regulator
MNLSELAMARGVKKSTMSVTMEQLLDRQWVLIASSKADARQKIYLITNKGRTLYHEVARESLAKLQHRWADYSANQWHDCLTMLNTLLTKNHD